MNKRSLPNLSEVVADGCVSDNSQDPPIQGSKYIFPGDVRREAYRLSTFDQHPITCSARRWKFVKSGFYFTGFADRVKCFACGRTVEKWEDADDPMDKKWHKKECAFQLGQECGNVPFPSQQIFRTVKSQASTDKSDEISNKQEKYAGEQQKKRHDSNLDDSAKRIKLAAGSRQQSENILPAAKLGSASGIQNQRGRQFELANVMSNNEIYLTSLYHNRELDRLASFAKWPTEKPSVTPADLAKNGFFYLGDSDRTQCFSCGGVLKDWAPDDDITAKHIRHSPVCKMANGNELHNVPVTQLLETEEEKEQKYPCSFATNPNMETKRLRLETFDHRWPGNRTNAIPAEFAEAGLFYLGERDRVKCWYCDGGLQDWERDDDPWEEHAKWYPTCQFLLRSKGVGFVYCHLASNAHLPRPVLPRQRNVRLSDPIMPQDLVQNAPSLPTTTVNSQEEIERRQNRVHFAMENSEIVELVLQMGFQKEMVAVQLENFMMSADQNVPDNIYESAEKLIDDLLQNEENLKRQVDEQNQTGEYLFRTGKEEGWKEAMQKLADDRSCKVCLVFPHNTVFIPCGHLCCCLVCALCLKNCPVCRRTIERFLQTYEA